MGLVDFKAALSPVNPTLSNGATQTTSPKSVMVVPTAVGTAAIQTALSHVTVLDAYGRDFAGSVAALVVQPQVMADRRIERRVQQMGDRRACRSAVSAGRWALPAPASARDRIRSVPKRRRAPSVTLTGTTGCMRRGMRATCFRPMSWVWRPSPMACSPMPRRPRPASASTGGRWRTSRADHGGGASQRECRAGDDAGLEPGWPRSARVVHRRGWHADGMPTGSGALRLGRGARTVMVEVHHRIGVTDGWALEGYGSLGVTRLKIDTASLVTGATPILGSRIGVQATGAVPGGLLTLGIAQPLAIEAARRS